MFSELGTVEAQTKDRGKRQSGAGRFKRGCALSGVSTRVEPRVHKLSSLGMLHAFGCGAFSMFITI